MALTYMTGTLVKMGQAVAAALKGGPRLGFLRYAVMWLALIAGADVGTLAEGRLGLQALALAALWAALLASLARKIALAGG